MDDIDALLDDALDNFETEQKAAQERSREVAEQRAKSAKLLEEALNEESEQQQQAAPQMDPAQMMQMLTQLASLAQQQSDGSAAPPQGKDADDQEAKLLDMAKQLISGVAAATGEAGEKQQLNDALGQLNRVQELSKKHQQLADKDDNSDEAQRVRDELEQISKNLQAQASDSAEQLKKAAGDAGISVEDAQRQLGAGEAAAAASAGKEEDLSAEERQKLDNFLKAMMVASMNNNNASAAVENSGAAVAASSSTQEQQQQDPAAAAAAQQEFMNQYYSMIFDKFTVIDQQYREWFSGPDGQKDKLSEADWSRYTEQHAAIQKLLQLRDKRDDFFAASERMKERVAAGADAAAVQDEDPNVAELNAVVERLQLLGDPPPGFKV